MKLMYITNSAQIAEIALIAGVDILFVDMEYMGKDIRQNGMDTVKNHHTIDDVKAIRRAIDSCNNNSELLVRVNPIHNNSVNEISAAIENGADIVMLPMWKTVDEVKTFVGYVNKRAKCCILLETKEAAEIIDDVLELEGIDFIYIGLNDLHLSYNMKFIFQPLTEGIVDSLAEKINRKNIAFGFGGIAKLREGAVPAEKVLGEHVRLNSKMVILGRSFCKPDTDRPLDELKTEFVSGVAELRKEEEKLRAYPDSFLEENHNDIQSIVNKMIKG